MLRTLSLEHQAQPDIKTEKNQIHTSYFIVYKSILIYGEIYFILSLYGESITQCISWKSCG